MKYRMVLIFCSSLFLFSCKNGTDEKGLEIVNSTSKDTNIVDTHNSQNSLDWSGTYSGVLPCAACDGIETEIVLNNDMTYVKKAKYLGEKEYKARDEKGIFVWDKTGSIVVLKGVNEVPSQYKVGENKLTQLDMEGNAITGSLANYYILKK